MKRLKCGFAKFQDNKYYALMIFLSMILAFEIYSYYEAKCIDNKEVYELSENKKSVDLEEIVYELRSKEFNILNMKKIDENSYMFEVAINGEKEQIYKVLKSLEKYTIMDYEFKVNSNNIDGKVMLSYN